MAVSDASQPGLAQYRALLSQATHASNNMFMQVLSQARQSMHDDMLSNRDVQVRDRLGHSLKLLDLHTPLLCQQFPDVLATFFQKKSVAGVTSEILKPEPLHLDQLELMDEASVREHVEMTRTLQHVLQQAKEPLAELNSYVSALLGAQYVNPDLNPLRPDSYVAAIQSLMDRLALPTWARIDWLNHMAEPLDVCLVGAYQAWRSQLQAQGVKPIKFAIIRAPGGNAAQVVQQVAQDVAQSRPARAVWSPEYRRKVLTLERLRQFMAGNSESPGSSTKEQFAQEFSREFEHPGIARPMLAETAFEATVPAAFEALSEMPEVEKVLQRMTQPAAVTAYRSDASHAAQALQSEREQILRQAGSMSQRLSLEVVSLMIDNLVQDTRLLVPVQQIILHLEPALLRLVLTDPRFFIDRKHPARRLLQEISQRALAFGTVDSPDFNIFLLSLQRHVSPLAGQTIHSAEPFELALKSLLLEWNHVGSEAARSHPVDSAMAALEGAEKRNLLAQQMATGMQQIPDMHQVPASIAEFLAGPWSQVLAHVQISDGTGAEDTGDYKKMVNVLLWSVQPALASKNIDKLTRWVPKLLAKLREGLRLIDYPPVSATAFFDVVMKLQQQAFNAKSAQPEPRQPVAAATHQPHPWVAPAEALASGFVGLPDESPTAAVAATALTAAVGGLDPEALGHQLAVGAWIEWCVDGNWQRLQLTWISPRGTMYLFVNLHGTTKSMTRRMFERLIDEGSLRIVSDKPMVDDALDAVVHNAALNSLKSDA